jgi:hypothetical protein
MSEKWTIEKINQFITDKVPESLNLEYKGAKALEQVGNKKDINTEITKDVSAMANSDGGTIIYGINETNYLIEPIDQRKKTKEWLAQVISRSIRPPINFIITPVSIDNENNVVYVVDISKGETAHQAKDKKYHKRFDTTTADMEDYEIRDVMGRNKYPKFELSFDRCNASILSITAKNIGAVYAKYINAIFHIPKCITRYHDVNYGDDNIVTDQDNNVYYKYSLDNKTHEHGLYSPILPSLSQTWEIPLNDNPNMLYHTFKGNGKLKWTIHADNAVPIFGEKYLREIKPLMPF